MGLFVIGVALIVLGFLVEWLDNRVNIDIEWVKFSSYMIGGITTAVAVLALLISYDDNKSFPTKYEITKSCLDLAIHNKNLTSDERCKVIESACEVNTQILNNRIYEHSFMFGIFNPKYISDMKTLDISQINPSDAKQLITIEHIGK